VDFALTIGPSKDSQLMIPGKTYQRDGFQILIWFCVTGFLSYGTTDCILALFLKLMNSVREINPKLHIEGSTFLFYCHN
jgi:hypothetical protein